MNEIEAEFLMHNAFNFSFLKDRPSCMTRLVRPKNNVWMSTPSTTKGECSMSLSPLHQTAVSIFNSGVLLSDNVSYSQHLANLRLALKLAQELLETREKGTCGGPTLVPRPPKPSNKPTDSKKGVQISVVPRDSSNERWEQLRRNLPINLPDDAVEPSAADESTQPTQDTPDNGTPPRPKMS
jgi:hypothetical protein